MEKALGMGIIAAVVVGGWLCLKPSEEAKASPTASSSVRPTPPPVPAQLEAGVSSASVHSSTASKVEETTQPLLVPAHDGARPKQILDADGVVLEERLPAPNGKGEVRKRYVYGEDGRVMRAFSTDPDGTMEQWTYTYDTAGKATITVIDSHGNATVR